MNNIELVLLRHEDEYLMNIFVLRVIGEGDKIKQKVLLCTNILLKNI